MPEQFFADKVAASAALLPPTSLLKESDMRIRPQFILVSIAMAALSQIAVAAGGPVEKPAAAQEHGERDAKRGKQGSNVEKKGVRLQGAPALNRAEQDLATISAQADAAEAACASQPGDSQQACRKQVNADRERAIAAIRSKHEQGVRKN